MTTVRIYDRKVLDAIRKKGVVAITRFGKFVRVAARSSLKKARLKKRSDLTQEQEEAYQSKLARFKRGGLKNKPVRGWQSSAPGEPPRWRPNPRYGGKSPLRNQIVYHVDKPSVGVIVGPEGWRTQAGTVGVSTLEQGGTRTYRTRRGAVVRVTTKKRPFMEPAFDKALSADVLLRGMK